MSETKVFELAKDLGITNSDLIAVLRELGITVTGGSSVLDASTAGTVREMVSQDKGIIKQAKTIEVPQALSVRELAEALGVQAADVQKRLVEMGILASVNQQIGADVAGVVAEKWGYSVKIVAKQEVREKPAKLTPQPKTKHSTKMVPRPPVITVMGHVDHGKTTLLDAIRRTNVTEQEFGGITQHIGAYQVDWKGKKITFLDTPGHEAFTAMRARGASVTDIAVLVVAADDAVMPQTVEAIHHARAAGVPIIVAINKIDKPEANVERTMQQLMEQELMPEEWGGDTIVVKTAAKAGQGIDELLEMILLVSEMADLRAEASASKVAGNVIEAQIDPRRGPVATVLIERGTLKLGAAVVAGEAFGKIKAMYNDKGERITKAGPATPVEILGLSSAPQAGDKLESAKDEREARNIADKRAQESRAERMASTTKITLEDLYKQIQEGTVKKLGIVLKADVQGSEEAVRQSLMKIEHEEVRVDIIHSSVGNINESDILLASASNAIVLGFNVKVDAQSARMAEAEHVEIRTYNVIYELTKDVRAAMSGLLAPVYEEVHLGDAEVRATFRLPNQGNVAGCYVTDGRVVRNEHVRVRRDGQVIFEGKLDTLKHLKEEVKEMAQGYECGIKTQGFSEYQIGDTIECYTQKQIARAV
ncbi:MAG: translation initiation factor IF-2 [Armatimonadetes bacterium]|nr:translation initiation factor IF-2 [Armatimonadota bacterium]